MLSFISRHLDFPCDDSDNDKNDGDDSDGDSDSNNNKNNKNNKNNDNNSNSKRKNSNNKSNNYSVRRNGKKEVLIIAIEENTTAMKVTARALLNMSSSNKDNKNNNSNLYQNVVYVRSYAECAGVLAAHKAGILLSSITSIVHKIPVTRL